VAKSMKKCRFFLIITAYNELEVGLRHRGKREYRGAISQLSRETLDVTQTRDTFNVSPLDSGSLAITISSLYFFCLYEMLSISSDVKFLSG